MVLAGADAVGLVFHPGSPRNVTPEEARIIAERVPAFVSVVALFVDAAPDLVRETLASLRVDVLQFHGEESAEYCRGFGKPWIKALRMHPDLDLEALFEDYAGACGILLDAYDPRAAGGTGASFDWSRIPVTIADRIILAGGLHSGNVAAALAVVGPYAVDVSSGVESERGVKDARKIEAFLREVQAFDYRASRGGGL